MTSLFDFFTGSRSNSSKKNTHKRHPADTRLCPGCPATIEPQNLELPKMRLPDAPKANSVSNDTKVVSIIDMSGYKKNRKPDSNALF